MSTGFAQWKDIMQLLLGCEEAPLRTRTALYVQFLAALRAQLRQSFGQVLSRRLVLASKKVACPRAAKPECHQSIS
jgi:hypothetical protein